MIRIFAISMDVIILLIMECAFIAEPEQILYIRFIKFVMEVSVVTSIIDIIINKDRIL